MRKKLLAWRDLAVCLIVLVLLLSIHHRFPRLDTGLRIAFVAFLIIYSCLYIWTRSRSPDSTSTGPAAWLRRWRRWATAQDADDNSRSSK